MLSLLSAIAFSQRPGYLIWAGLLQAASWVAQFLGHGLAEKRAPALLDNLIGGMIFFQLCQSLLTHSTAVVLAPFFVHLEILFGLGYRPAMHKRINNEIGKEITKIRKAEGVKRHKEL